MANLPLHGVDDGQAGSGVIGESAAGLGVLGISQSGAGVEGRTSRQGDGPAVQGSATNNGPGVGGTAFGPKSTGVWGQGRVGVQGNGNADGEGVRGIGGIHGAGVTGAATNNFGMQGTSTGNDGVNGTTTANGKSGVSGFCDANGHGVWGGSAKGIGMFGTSPAGDGVHGESQAPGASGVAGSHSTTGHGVWGSSVGGIGVYGVSAAASVAGVFGDNGAGGLAGYFRGNVIVTGDIVLNNADCAEDFEVLDFHDAEPGTVMIIADGGVLQPSEVAYDKCVAGVVSGAGTLKPGLILDRQQTQGVRRPVALLGKVYCKVDARSAAIKTGDLLTSASIKGHAMKAIDPSAAFGSVIGKALEPLDDGLGLIRILISL